MIECNLKDFKLPDAEKIAKAFRATRKELLDEAETHMQKTVDDKFRFSGMTIRSGAIRNWQTLFREAGYAAVRPQAAADGPRHPSPGPNSPGAITSYLESGHVVRVGRLSGSNLPGRGRVLGFNFYERSRKDIRSYEKKLAEECAVRIAEKINNL